MKNLVLASALGTLAGAFALPALGGPIHYAITRPYSLFGNLPPSPGLPISVVLGIAPLDFILTDIMLGSSSGMLLVTVNGTPVLNLGTSPGVGVNGDTHLTSGIFIPAGSSIGVQVDYGQTSPVPVTLAGYVQ